MRTLFSAGRRPSLFVFLLVAGLLLLTGASIMGILRSTREHVGHHPPGQALHEQFAAVFSEEQPAPRRELPEDEPPEVEPVVRATHVEMPILEEADEAPEPG